MITHAHQEHPALSIRRLCELFGVGRTWFYSHPAPEEIASRDVVLRDAIERIVLEFPGYHPQGGYPSARDQGAPA